MLVMTLVGLEAIHPFTMTSVLFDKHHMLTNIPWNPYPQLATIVLLVRSSAQFLFLHNVLPQLMHVLQQGHIVFHNLGHTYATLHLIPFYISVVQ